MYALKDVAMPDSARLILQKDGLKADLFSWMVDVACYMGWDMKDWGTNLSAGRVAVEDQGEI